MDYYQRLLDILKEKKQLSHDFLEITSDMRKIKKDDNFADNLNVEISKRNDIIDMVNNLDTEFIKIFTEVKKDRNFGENINKYPQFSELIEGVKSDFKQAYDMDLSIKKDMDGEFDLICSLIKSNKEKRNTSNKYTDNSIENITGSNFGIFLDEKK